MKKDLNETIKRVQNAQKLYVSYSQEQVDEIFRTAANDARIKLAKMAVKETGMGIVEDKVLKNHFASEYGK